MYPIVEVPVGRTNIVLDDGLIKQAMQVSGAKTKRQAVDWALRELVELLSTDQDFAAIARHTPLRLCAP